MPWLGWLVYRRPSTLVVMMESPHRKLIPCTMVTVPHPVDQALQSVRRLRAPIQLAQLRHRPLLAATVVIPSWHMKLFAYCGS